jgi:hypothetical protein
MYLLESKTYSKMINERTPFYLIATVFTFVAILMSLIGTFHSQNNLADFFPAGGDYHGRYIHDENFIDKICWYFSQLTHHTLFLLFSYFFMALLTLRSEKFFKIIAPLALTISVLYFYFLFPRQKLKLHQLSFASFFSHFMIIFLVFGELMYIKSYEFAETTNCLVFIITALLCVWINYCLRGVWSYNIIRLDTFAGWKLTSITVIVMYLFSVMFYLFKFKGWTNMKWTEGGYFISSLLNLIYALGFVSIKG